MKFTKRSAMALLSLTFALSASASSTPIAADQVQTYLTAVEQGGALDLPCSYGLTLRNTQDGDSSYTGNISLQRALDAASKGTIDTSGAQPALTLISTLSGVSDGWEVDFSFTITADGKSVSHVDIAEKQFQEVNQGTILNPNEQEEWVTMNTYSCTPAAGN